MERAIFGLLLVLAAQATTHAQYRVTRDANGYAQWPHSNHDGIQQPLYRPDMYPGDHTQWSMSTSDDPAMVRQYRMVLEEYDRVHGTHKNPYPPLSREFQHPVPRPVQAQEASNTQHAYRWGWRLRR